MAISNLEQTSKFYTALGLKPNNPHTSSELVSDDNFSMHFVLKDMLRPNLKGKLANTQRVNEIIFTLSAESHEQIKAWTGEVEKAGSRLVLQPEEFGNCYYGFVFANPNGHRFSVFHR